MCINYYKIFFILKEKDKARVNIFFLSTLKAIFILKIFSKDSSEKFLVTKNISIRDKE